MPQVKSQASISRILASYPASTEWTCLTERVAILPSGNGGWRETFKVNGVPQLVREYDNPRSWSRLTDVRP